MFYKIQSRIVNQQATYLDLVQMCKTYKIKIAMNYCLNKQWSKQEEVVMHWLEELILGVNHQALIKQE